MIGGVIGVKDIQTEDGFFREDSGQKTPAPTVRGNSCPYPVFFYWGC